MDRLGIGDVVLYTFDWGGPIGMRLAERRTDSIRGLVVQNANLYLDGLSEPAREFISLEADAPEATSAVMDLLTERGTRQQYLTGARAATAIAPESWFLDQAYLDRGDRKRAQLSLAFDYKSNLSRYEDWQAWLAAHQVPTLIVWGRHDPFFTVDGALAYLKDLPEADVHLLDAGHFALEERVETIASLLAEFLKRRVG